MGRLGNVLLSLLAITGCAALLVLVMNQEQTQRDIQVLRQQIPAEPFQEATVRPSKAVHIAHNQQVVPLQSPLTTFSAKRSIDLSSCSGIEAQILIPDDAPADLGVGIYVKDQDGHWFQHPLKQHIKPGIHHLYVSTANENMQWQAEPFGMQWNAYRKQHVTHYGLYFWSEHESTASIAINHLRLRSDTNNTIAQQHYAIQHIDGFQDGDDYAAGKTGQRWEVHLRCEHLPHNPFNPELIRIDGIITNERGQERRYPAFYYQPVALHDGGDSERESIHEPGYFVFRYRPKLAGRYQVRLSIAQADQAFELALPDLLVSGTDFDDYIYTAQNDHRFFSLGKGTDAPMFWPIGINLRSVEDSRGHENTRCVPTPNRGSLSYAAYLDRYANAGANCAEIWMCSWNLALEWRPGWPGFYGAGYYHQGNAERLDRILDMAYARGMRIILVLNNHGQGSSRVDSEWDHHPYNRRNGGFLQHASDLFTDHRAIKQQDILRRYIVGRYADHPAIMCWKLWTEQDLTDVGLRTRGRGNNRILTKWHQQAAQKLKVLDHYNHPVVSHWSQDYKIVNRDTAALTELDAVFIDAYHGDRHRHALLADLLHNSLYDQRQGLASLRKPILCTEFGGTPTACPEPQLLAEHLHGPWTAMVSGHAGAPLLWWFEWVDQQDLWHPYQAVSRFLQGEQLSGPDTRSAKLNIKASQRLWTRAWIRPGRMLGYILDYNWGYRGTAHPLIQTAQLRVGNNIRAGQMQLEWWDASLGHKIHQQAIDHPGGVLEITIPDFRRHLAFKLFRP